MSFLTDEIAKKAAEFTQVVPPPTGDLGFGVDLDCVDDLTPTMAEVGGDDVTIVAQANYRRLRTPRGTLIDAPDDGIDVRSFLNKAMTPTQVAAMTGQIRNELGKDDRNETIDEVSITESTAGSFELRVRGTTGAGPFSLTFALTDEDVLLKEMSA